MFSWVNLGGSKDPEPDTLVNTSGLRLVQNGDAKQQCFKFCYQFYLKKKEVNLSKCQCFLGSVFWGTKDQESGTLLEKKGSEVGAEL